MATLDVNSLFNSMITAAKKSLQGSAATLTQLASNSFKGLAQTLVDIQEMQSSHEITAYQADLLVDMGKNTLRTVMLTEEGLALLAVQNAINAALDAVRTSVNKAIGFTLL